MLADFREYYGLHLPDVLRFDGSLPVWEAAILATQLPPTSRTVAVVSGGIEYWGWTLDRHLLAATLDAINTHAFAFVQSNTKKKVKQPYPVPRPGDAERKKQAALNNPFAMQVNKAMNDMKSVEEA